MDTEFEREWLRRQCADDETAWIELGAGLRSRHEEPHRAYHGTRHVLSVLEQLELLAEHSVPDELALAAFFHDAIYDPRRADNEQLSAALAVDALGALSVSAGVIARTAAVVEATASHQPTGDPDIDLFLDADLAILGAAPTLYEKYTTDIRFEYRHLADDSYRDGRRAVLEGFLARDHLFLTEKGRRRFEVTARANLAREIASLTT